MLTKCFKSELCFVSTENWSRDQLMQKAYYHLINVNITLKSFTPVRSWDIVTPLEKMTYSP